MIAVGLFFLTLGGFTAGSFYIPLKKVKNWAWESYWLINGLSAWLIVPWLAAYIAIPNLRAVLSDAPSNAIIRCFILGLFWGIGGLTFGLSIRFLGLSLGYALAFGFCSAFGTLIPPICFGTFGELLTRLSGQVTLAGVVVCLGGIAICALAGTSKEKELAGEKKKTSEFHFLKGLFAAFCAGLLIACMAISIALGKPLVELALQNGASPLWKHFPTIAITCIGGFITNLVWCVFLNIKKGTWKNYITNTSDAPMVRNYFFAALAGLTWYLQIMFYGMGMANMGKYAYSSWTVRMAFVIIFSNMWGLIFKEWKGCSKKTLTLIITGLAVIMLSVVFIGTGGHLASLGK